MKISISTVGRFREVAFCDFEDEQRCAYSGLLAEDDAHDLADELYAIATQLRSWADRDANQILLPFARAA